MARWVRGRASARRLAVGGAVAALVLAGCAADEGLGADQLAGRGFWVRADDPVVPEATAVRVGEATQEAAAGADVELDLELVVGDCVVPATLVVGDDRAAVEVEASATAPCGPAAVDVVALLSTVDGLGRGRDGNVELLSGGDVVAELAPIDGDGHA